MQIIPKELLYSQRFLKATATLFYLAIHTFETAMTNSQTENCYNFFPQTD